MNLTLIILALLLSAISFPLALRFAKKHNIVDNPDARKLQKEPVPVFGGISVVIGIIVPLLIAIFFYGYKGEWYILSSILLLWGMGVTDDIRGLPASLRFVMEVFLMWILIWQPLMPSNGPMIDSLWGFGGRMGISLYSALPLTLLAGVGIINAINLIDGIDGYSSGYGIVANVFFTAVFGYLGNSELALFAGLAAAALVPFFLHNVFGRTSKMFIGDGGSLVIGLILAYEALSLLSHDGKAVMLFEQGISPVALALAILGIPVFDTIRVMVARLCQRRSPFSPDKSHLHHVFVDMHFSHAGTSMVIILLNCLIVAFLWLGYRTGMSVQMQVWWVCFWAVLFTFGLYYGLRIVQKRSPRLWSCLCRLGIATQKSDNRFWLFIQRIVDWRII